MSRHNDLHSLVTPHTPNKKYWVGHIGPGTLTRPHARERERERERERVQDARCRRRLCEQVLVHGDGALPEV